MEPRLEGMHAAGEAESCADMVRCMHSLTDLELSALQSLLRHGPMTSDQLARRLRRDRSTVYRSPQKLLSCQVVRRELRALARGGYYHAYSTVHRDVIKRRPQGCVDGWHAKMRSMLERSDEDMGGT